MIVYAYIPITQKTELEGLRIQWLRVFLLLEKT